MTVSYSLMYWLTRLDGLNAFFAIAVFLLGFGLTILFIAHIISCCDKYDDDAPTVAQITKKFIKILLFPWIIGLFGILFVPSSKEMAMIYVVPHISESQVIKQDVPELYDLGITALKDWLKNMNEQK